MNDFEAKYIKKSSLYLQERLKSLQIEKKNSVIEDEKQSVIKKMLALIFK
jgi:hypothetical protein